MTVLVTMGLLQRPDGADVARCGEHVAVSRHGATMALARALVAAGVPDGPWQAERNGVPVLRGPSLHRLAGLTVIETEAGARGFGRFKPKPGDAWNADSPAAMASPEPVQQPAAVTTAPPEPEAAPARASARLAAAV